MRLKVKLLGAAALIGILAIGSKPEPAVAFACSRDTGCTGGCKTVLDPTGAYEGVHVCATGCSWPGCIKTFGVTTPAQLESLVEKAAAGEIKAAVKLATKYPASVRYNADRHALMYYSACTGDIPIGVQPLTPSQGQAVASAIAD